MASPAIRSFNAPKRAACLPIGRRRITPILAAGNTTVLSISSGFGQRRSCFYWRMFPPFERQFGAKDHKSLQSTYRFPYKYARSIPRSSLRSRQHSNPYKEVRGWRWFRSGRHHGRTADDFSQAWRKKFHVKQRDFDRDFEELKQQIDADPYGMIFGRRLESFYSEGKEHPLSSFWRAVFGPEITDTPPSKHKSDAPSTTSTTGETCIRQQKTDPQRVGSDRTGLQFDPISGRMVPRSCKTSNKPRGAGTNNEVGLPVTRCVITGPPHTTISDFAGKPQKKNGDSLIGGPRHESNRNAAESPEKPHDTAHPDGTATASSHDISQKYSPHAYLSRFKDYVCSKIETGEHDHGKERSSQPTSSKASKDPSLTQWNNPLSAKASHLDSESSGLDNLLASDIRASFKRRNSELDIESKSALFEDTATTGFSQTQEDNEARKRIDEICEAYDDTYNPVAPPVHHLKEGESKAASSRSNNTPNLELHSLPPKTAASDPKLSAILLKLEQTIEDANELNRSTSSLLKELAGSQMLIRKSIWKRAAQPKPTEDYRILIYDSSSLKVRDAGISSSQLADFTPLHPAEAISRLNNPSQFIDFLPRLSAEGYEIFSAGGDMIVFKRAREVCPERTAWTEQSALLSGESASSPAKEGAHSSSQTKQEAAAMSGSSSANSSVHSPKQAGQLEEESINQVESTELGYPSSAAKKNLRPSGQKSVDREPKVTRDLEENSTKSTVHSPSKAAQLKEESIEQAEAIKPKETNTANEQPTASASRSSEDSTNQDVHSPTRAAGLEQESIEQLETPKFESTHADSSAKPTYVRRQESVFSGGQTKWSSNSSKMKTENPPPPPKEKGFVAGLRRTLRRVFLAGSFTAASCYAIGVVAEYFRTGGQDGLGPQGFTGLEGR